MPELSPEKTYILMPEQSRKAALVLSGNSRDYFMHRHILGKGEFEPFNHTVHSAASQLSVQTGEIVTIYEVVPAGTVKHNR